MKIAVLGAGFTGLTAAYYLAKAGQEVIVFEKERTSGGLASGFKHKDWDWPLEFYYHHFFSNDKEVQSLTKELNLESRLFFKKPQTAIYHPDLQPSISPFDSPLALIKFPHLTLTQKIRTGAVLGYLKTLSNYKSLEQIAADAWLERTMGQRAFEILWEPLLRAKFGDFSSQVSAAWFWARIKKRTKSLGYFEGGFQNLADCLVKQIQKLGGKVILNQEVKKLANRDGRLLISTAAENRADAHLEDLEFDQVISTLPTPVFLEIIPTLDQGYIKRLSSIAHLWAQTLILELTEPFLKEIYWLNINDASSPFLAVVEHTNFIDKSHYGGHHLLYIGNYLPDGHPYLKQSATELLTIFKPFLIKINPKFNFENSITNFRLSSAPFAQPVVALGYKPPPFETPLENLYFANLDCVYPWDRGVNYAIESGQRVAELAMGSG